MLCVRAGLAWACSAGDGRGSDTRDAARIGELRLDREPASPQWAGCAQLMPIPGSRGPAALEEGLALRAGDYSPGDQLGKYRVLEVLGRGSNGVTYKARAGPPHVLLPAAALAPAPPRLTTRTP